MGRWKEGGELLEAILRHIYEKKLSGKQTWDLIGCEAKQGRLESIPVF